MSNVKISELPAGTTLDGTEIIPAVQDGDTVGVTAQEIANLAGGGGGYTEITGTLTAGNTSLVLQDAAITTAATYDYYTSVYGVNPVAVVATTGSMTLTFEAQQTNIDVKVRVS